MAELKQGDSVEWTWGTRTAEGTVDQTFTRRVTRKMAGKSITRNGSEENPAVLIRQSDGGRVLKLASELRKA